jgi:hypothetical protein
LAARLERHYLLMLRLGRFDCGTIVEDERETAPTWRQCLDWLMRLPSQV